MDHSDVSAERPALIEATSVALGMSVFGLMIRGGGWQFGVALAGLAAVAIGTGRCVAAGSGARDIIGLRYFSRGAAVLTFVGCVLGFTLGVVYRFHSGMTVFPGQVGKFLLITAAIGGSEEFLYRGYLQGRLEVLGAGHAIFLAAIAHAAYKCSLFLLADVDVPVNLIALGGLTFLFGSVFGALRWISASLVPALAAHVVFDLVAYGGLDSAPWWVWD